MKVCESINQGKPTLSFEFFPPKTKEQEEHLLEVLAELKKFQPDFASVTCGALGSNRDKTLFWAEQIKDKFGIEPVVHLTCVAATRQSVLQQLKDFDRLGIKNILALRGDPPEGEKAFVAPKDGFGFARDLVAFIKGQNMDFCVGVAGYPEGHRESGGLDKDTQYLKEKVEAGADYIISQLFFDDKYFFDFVARCRAAGIQAPIIPGLMTITSLKQIKKMTEICGASLPDQLIIRLDESTDVAQLGVEQSLAQCRKLIAAGVPGLHFFVMNKSGPISKVLQQLKFDRQR